MAQLYSSLKDLVHRISIVADPELGQLVGSLALPAVGFEIKPRPTSSFRGGAAPLPKDAPWPELAGTPLDFLAAFDLGRVPEIDIWRAKPASGTLSFFAYPTDSEDYIGLIGAEGFGQVIFTEVAEMTERAHPQGSMLDRRYLKPTEPMWTLPPAWSPATSAALGGDPDVIEAYQALGDKLWASQLTGVDSQLVGHPEPWQQDPTSDDGVCLLAEIGDVVGSYYFTIEDEDLAALDFSKVACESQSD